MTITGVPEHFNEPFHRAMAEFNNFPTTWKMAPGGTGQMRDFLENGEADVAIMLFEGAVKAISQGLTAEIHSVYVNTPLIWGIHVGHEAINTQIPELPLLISRMGSGSHLIPFVMAQQEDWENYQPELIEIKNLDGALKALQKNPEQIFFWEKYTTNPYVEKGLLKRIGEFPTPWPAFVIVKHKNCLDNLDDLLPLVHQHATDIKNGGQTEVYKLAENYQLKPEKVSQWLIRTEWFGKVNIEKTIQLIELALDKTGKFYQ